MITPVRFKGLSGTTSDDVLWMITCNDRHRQIFVESSQYHFVVYEKGFVKSRELPKFRIDFESYSRDVRKELLVTHDTPTSAYVTSWGFDWMANHLCINNASHTMTLPGGHVVMLSFPRFDLQDPWNDCPDAGVWLYSIAAWRPPMEVMHRCTMQVIEANVYKTSILLLFKTQKFCNFGGSGLKAHYTFIPSSHAPERLDNFLFNCSTSHYPSFKTHLDCNLEYECEANEDEGGHCPYSSPACGGMVSAGNKCYEFMEFAVPISAYAAQRECARRNGDLAMMKTYAEWEGLKKMFKFGKRYYRALIGVRSGDHVLPDMYKYMVKWVDNSIAQNVHVITDSSELYVSYRREYEKCGALLFAQKFNVVFVRCIHDVYSSFICQVSGGGETMGMGMGRGEEGEAWEEGRERER